MLVRVYFPFLAQSVSLVFSDGCIPHVKWAIHSSPEAQVVLSLHLFPLSPKLVTCWSAWVGWSGIWDWNVHATWVHSNSQRADKASLQQPWFSAPFPENVIWIPTFCLYQLTIMLILSSMELFAPSSYILSSSGLCGLCLLLNGASLCWLRPLKNKFKFIVWCQGWLISANKGCHCAPLTP